MYKKISELHHLFRGNIIYDPKTKRYWMRCHCDDELDDEIRQDKLNRFICILPNRNAGFTTYLDDNELLKCYYVGAINDIDESKEPQEYKLGDVVKFKNKTNLFSTGRLGLICRTAPTEVHVIDLYSGDRYSNNPMKVPEIKSLVISIEQLKEYLAWEHIENIGQISDLLVRS